MLAMLEAGIKVERYVAFEIDKYAVYTSSYNFPMIEHSGDVFYADFTEFRGFDFLVGGSPCTYWSIAQQNNRETEASGMGWELFSQYVRALHEAQPLFFIYENNKSMSSAIRESITEAFGFEPICINSALVSAQNRQRLYWVGKRNADGTYSRVNVEQPYDCGILLCNILDGVGVLPVNATCDGKARTLRATCYKDGIRNMVGNEVDRKTCVAEPVDYKFCDRSTIKVYEVKGGQITINGKQYSIELADGFYLFRKLTVRECMKLQTVPEWYEFPVSNTQAYKMLGNGWTVQVIVHLINATQAN